MRLLKNVFVCTLLLFVTSAVFAQTRAQRILNELNNPNSKYVIVAAHRGDWRNFPENSLEGYESAIRMGVDIVEIDVRRTADGELIICHDATINRTTSGKGRVDELTLKQIRKCCLRAGHGIKMKRYKVPTLDEVLDLCKDRILINIDKGYDYYDEIMPKLIKRNMVNQVIIKSKVQPEDVIKKYASYKENMLYMPIIDYTKKKWSEASPLFDSYLKGNCPLVAYEICWNGTMPNVGKVFKKVLDSKAHLWVNTMWASLCGGDDNAFEDDRAIYGNEDAVYGPLLEMGATMFQTDRPAMLIGYLEGKGRHTLR
ncbi:MAG: glycerophosphodiester phosphodiesterase family protein [Alistipes sp.]|nr:glycerophosphodiester phosphodiesterase family protein [Candidatus Alistipes equi]